MSKNAVKWEGFYPVTRSAHKAWLKDGFMFSGSPPLSNYYPREWLVAIAAIMGRPLDIADLKLLFTVQKESETLGGRRHKRVNLVMFGDQHASQLVSNGIAETIRRRGDLITSSVIVPVSKFNQVALFELVTKAHRANTPRRRNVSSGGVVAMGENGPGGDRHTVKSFLRKGIVDLRVPRKARFLRGK